ncbi:hypothetical protein [Lactococcus formosensis]|uniref:hypothetical protein n=1 Tax=Lactococcus formosensis TaxID=1281486 RepID=UPI00243518A0|nr:hypothetical protein [Lactococcus formosensis]MDG6113758.1 hypothetical protein [Lactococcus formosensis]MDG6122251.1 hypothetical protein [Lactococcus formosensis]MDG6151857.1 hypothetical protein [Lactococcus formosensis]MDG6174923.1 hypothetical protein [Lactococcus formosensis]MDG6181241.1 hypothetical protein [Lactococcus formosensis]
MTVIKNFEEYKRKIQRGMSNEEFLKSISEFFIEADCILVTGRFSNGNLETFNTQNNSLETLGLIEVARQQILETMRD